MARDHGTTRFVIGLFLNAVLDDDYLTDRLGGELPSPQGTSYPAQGIGAEPAHARSPRNRCGETFTPADLGDLEHVETVDGTACSGKGKLAGIAKLLGSEGIQGI
ncbi:hypothetical protein AB0I98_35485 [Streptomyces sp. NPDC050211]|uniref:hypothetical protein n=1 Tax=Streptomyces sp. NPDC050211 TaxID=3154932 RepID=UPI0034370706